jgi:uncharacterized protein (DUF1697 family)
MRYAALLRGVNVGGHGRLPMAELRTLLEGLGYRDVATYLQSGQAVLATEEPDEDAVAARIRDALTKHLGAEIDVMVRGHDYLRAVLDDCPFPAGQGPAKQFHVAYASAGLDPSRFEAIDPTAFEPERFALGDRHIYFWLPDGIGRSKLATKAVGRRILGQETWVTVRNWNTAVKLADLTTEH